MKNSKSKITQKWRSIKSAPKNGTLILVVLENCDEDDGIGLARFSFDKWCDENYEHLHHQPYLWMPLPKKDIDYAID